MSDPFDSPKQSINHARDEIKAAEQMIADYVGLQRAAKVVYDNAAADEKIYCVRITGPIMPPKIANLVKDGAANLRDALDHTVYSAAVVLAGGSPGKTGFPFGKDAAGVVGELNSKRLADNPPEIRPLLMGFKPYEGGNDILWAMNQVRNPNTHRFIVPVGSAAMLGGLGINMGIIRGGQIGYSKWDATKNEIEYMRLSRDSTIDHEVNISVNITFEGIKAVAGKQVIPTLRLMADEAERVVSAIEAEIRKIVASRGP